MNVRWKLDDFQEAIGDMEVSRARWEKEYGMFMEDPSIHRGIREMESAVVMLLMAVINLRRVLEDEPKNERRGTGLHNLR